MSGSAALWSEILPVHRRILEHPFLRGLADGSLPSGAFARYVIQDGLFLRDYARALALCGARSPDGAMLELFCRHAVEAVGVERDLHERLMAQLGIDPAEAARAEPSPTCLAYTRFLLSACALGDVAEAVAAVLPCFWIYWEVGKVLTAAGSPDPRYRAWIATYGGEDFAAAAQGVIEAADRVLEGLPPQRLAAAGRQALIAARLEWRFFDSALRDERWLEP